MFISIVVPTYNESSAIRKFLAELFQVILAEDEVIVVDGLSEDDTREIIKNFSRVRLFTSTRGRATQMNFGAGKARNDYILLLHADNIISANGINMLREEIKCGRAVWGWFPIKLNSSKLAFKILEIGANFRLRLTKTPLGDHGMFVRKDAFQRIGGFPEIPLMEDLEFVDKIKTVSKGVEIRCPIGTSVRRFEKHGILKTFITMWLLRILFYSGVSSEKLAGFYKHIR